MSWLMGHDYSSIDLPLHPLLSQSLCGIHHRIYVGDVLAFADISFFFFPVFLKVNTFLILYGIKDLCVSDIHRTERWEDLESVTQQQTHTKLSVANCGRFVVSSPGKANSSPCFHLPQGLKEIKCLSGAPCQIKHLLSICITSLCLSPRLLEVFFALLLGSPLCVWPMIAFSPLHKSSPSAQLCLFGWVATGKEMQVHNSLGLIAMDKAVGCSYLDIKVNPGNASRR